MNDLARAFVQKLKALEPAKDDEAPLVETLYGLVDGVENMADPTEVFPAVFQFLEAHPLAEHGEPGPLVHLVERSFPGGYEPLLLESLRRRPTRHTVWMANRLLNSPDVQGNLRGQLLKALEAATSHPKADSEARGAASGFIEFQAGNHR